AGLRAGIEALTETVGGIAALLVIPLVLATAYEVFARYIFGAPTIWAFELGYILMGLHFLLGGAIALKRQAHVRIDLIYARLTPKHRAVIDLTLYLLIVLPVVTFITIWMWSHAAGAFLSGERTGHSAWNPPIWPFRAVICASFGVLALQIVAECIKAFDALRYGADYPRA
ncbi:MAG: TRAP transporter small permease subunit, partial [Pseudomonadota bacterium]